MISCAAREMFEETGVLLARGSETLTVGQRTSLLDDLESKRMTWPELLVHYGLRLDANDFTFAGRWVTPRLRPEDLDTWFFLANCPAKQWARSPRMRNWKARLDQRGRGASAMATQRNYCGATGPACNENSGGGDRENLVDRFLSSPGRIASQPEKSSFILIKSAFPCARRPGRATHTNCYLITLRMKFW